MTVVPPDAAVGETGPVLVGDDESDHAGRAVRHAAIIARRLGRDVVRMHVEEGNPAAALGDAAREQQACLIVAGSRAAGHSALSSSARSRPALVQNAGRPMVVVSASAGEPR